MGIIHYVEPTGDITTEKAEKPPSLEDMQKYVGGFIEVVHVMWNQKRTQMIVNEEGLILKLPGNWKASCVYSAHAITQHGQIPTNRS